MDPVSVRDITADGNARIHVGNSSVTHVHNYADTHDQPEEAPVPFSLMPFSRDPDFIARGDILDQIATHCGQAAGRAALVGLGGVGKSQLAIEYSYQTRDEKKDAWIFWVHAGTRARVEEGFRAIADAVKLPGRYKPKADIPQLLHTWLSDERNGKWLMILDSADDQEVFYGVEKSSGQRPLASYLPQSPNGAILVTTRDQAFAVRLTGSYKSIIKVGPMTAQEALFFLEKKLGALFEPDLGAELVSALDCIPLAINQAASYIQARAPRSSIKKYLAEFRESEKKSARLLAHDAAELRRDGSSSNAIMKTWQISFDHIRSKQPSAADLLALMSFFDNQSIPEAALQPEEEYDSDCDSDLESNWDTEELANHSSMKRLLEAKQRRDTIYSSDDDDDLSSETESGFEEDIALLRDYCLIFVCESGTKFEMHRLVQLATKKWLASSKRQEEFKQMFIYRLALSAPEAKGQNELRYRDMMSHFQIAIRLRPNKTNLRFWFHLCYCISWYMGFLGQYDKAKNLLEKALEAWAERKGREHYNYLLGQVNIVSYMAEMDKYEKGESEAILLRVLEIQERTLPVNSDATLSTMEDLAYNYRQQATLGREHRTTLSCMSRLSATYFCQSRYDEAEKIDLQVLSIQKKNCGPSHYDTLFTMMELATLYTAQVRDDEAIELSLQALQLHSASCEFEDQDQTWIRVKTQLAGCYQSQSFYDKSLVLNEEILRILTAKFGPDHDETLMVMQQVADGLKRLGRYEESENTFILLLGRLKARFGLAHHRTACCIKQLSKVYVYRRQPSKAEVLLVELLDSRTSTHGLRDDWTLDTMVELAKQYQQSQQSNKSSDMFARVLAICTEINDVDFLDGLGIWESLSTACLHSQSQFEDLATILQVILTFRKAKYPPDDDFTLNRALQLAAAKEGLAQWDDAANICSETLQLCQDKREQEQYDEARRLQSFVLEARKEKLGLEDPTTLSSMHDLAMVLEEQGQLAEAEELYRQVIRGHGARSTTRSKGSIWARQQLAHIVARLAIEQEARVEEATELLRNTLEMTEREYGHGTMEVYNFAALAGWRLMELDLFEEAAKMVQLAYEGLGAMDNADDGELHFCLMLLALIRDWQGDLVGAVEMQRRCLHMSRRVNGSEHPDTISAQERWDGWAGWLEQQAKEHAEEADHPFESCQTCLARECVGNWESE
ncbi:kinesin [Cordyceps javanica]|uniref:Kinesin n=1 Tax=Cordyceps javanica TaxID=43265 RepID=A0A545UWC6_9HYPO|nr:kinesin [Cordyceps javanica]TQW04539.1 kinesin [Cordyceps javanica]